MSTLERAIAIAADSHAGSFEKAGAPYVLHPLRVMLRMDTVEERIAAVLHDVVEDTDVTLEDLRIEGFSKAVLDAVEALTHEICTCDDDYFEAIRRAAANPIARRVKHADLEDNLDLSRIPEPTEKDFKRLERYKKALKILDAQLAV